MRSIRRTTFGITFAVAVMAAVWAGAAGAAPTVQSSVTDDLYTTVTVTFTEDVAGAAGGPVTSADVALTGVGANLVSVAHAGAAVTLTFDGPVQPATGVLAFTLEGAEVAAEIPVADGDWAAIDSALRVIPLPGPGSTDIPIAAAFFPAPDAAPRTVADLLPAITSTSTALPDGVAIQRNADATFTALFSSATPLITMPLGVSVGVDTTADGTAYLVQMAADADIDLAVSLDGTVSLDGEGVLTSGALTLGVAADPGVAPFAGSVGPVAATADIDVAVDASLAFEVPLAAQPPAPPTSVQGTASADVSRLLIGGIGPDGTDIDLTGAPLVGFDWPTLPTSTSVPGDAPGDPAVLVRTETVTATDGGWDAAGLRSLANVGLTDVLGAPGALATWLLDAQSLGVLDTQLPLVGTDLGDVIGVGESLGSIQNRMALALAAATDPFFGLELDPLLGTTLCADLRPASVLAERMSLAVAGALTAEASLEGPALEAAARALYPSIVLDDPEGVGDAFIEACGFLHDRLTLDLAAQTIELDVSVDPHEFVFLPAGGPAPALDLSDEGAGLAELAVAATGGAWTGTTTTAIDLTLGLKLDTDADLFSELSGTGLVVDLDSGPGSTLDAGDITAAHRIFVPADSPIASAGVSLTGTGLTGTAQIGFLDLGLTGDVALTPTVGLTPTDPASGGLVDGRVDLAELFAATAVDGAGVASVLDVDLAGDDVDASFTFTNDLVAVDAQVDVAGDLSGLLRDGGVEFRTTAIGGPDDVDADTLAIGQTFGEDLALAALTPFDVVVLVADALDGLAANAGMGAGDARIPLIDVSLDEVSGFTSSLSAVATAVRDRGPETITELQGFVDDALAAQGLGVVTLGFEPVGPTGGPELTLAVEASQQHTAAYPVNFELSDALGPIQIAPTDGGSTLEATVEIEFTPVLGITLDDDAPIGDRVFVRDITPRFAVLVEGDAEGAVTLGPLEASVRGDVTFGALGDGQGLTAALVTDDGSTTVALSALIDGEVTVDVTGEVPVEAELTLDVPLLDTTGTVALSGTLLDPVLTSELEVPDLRALLSSITLDLGTLSDGAIQSARFIARGSSEVAGLTGTLPVVGPDVSTGFEDVSDVMDLVADEIEVTIAALTESEDVTVVLDRELDVLLTEGGCTICGADVSWVPGPNSDPDGATILDAQGIEVLLTIADSRTDSTSTSASLGLDPVVDISVDITDATADIGYRATIGLGLDRVDGFYLFPGDDGDDENETGNLLELYAGLSLDADIDVTLAGVQAGADGANITVGGALDGGTAAGFRVAMDDRLPFSDIVNRSRKFSDVVVPSLNAEVTASLPVALPVDLGGGVAVEFEFPFEMYWSIEDTLTPSLSTATVSIDGASLDASSLTGPVAAMLREFDENYNPLGLDAIKDVLETELPLIEVRVKDALLAACRLNASTSGRNPVECTAFDVLTDIEGLADTIEGDPDSGMIDLGSFQIYPAPDPGVSRYTPPGASDAAAFAQAGPPGTPTRPGVGARIRTLTGGFMSLPILDDYPAIMGIVLGGELADDVDFVRFEIPAATPLVLGKGFNLRQELFSLDAGFIKGNLTVAINGKLGLSVSGGFGYSSRGVSTGNPADGIFLVDGPGNEVEIGAAINASVDGSFDVFIADVRFRGTGGLSVSAGIDLFDESPVLAGRGGGDGKLNVDEIVTIGQAYNPPLEGLPSELCMFQLRATGSWYLSFSGKLRVLGFTVFDESFDERDTLFDETLSCTLRTRIAKVEERQLILLGGPNAADRLDGEGDVDERFGVSLDGANLRVTWLGGTAKPDMLFPAADVDVIIADLGEGADHVEVDEAITISVIGRGGPGDDTVTGGGGPDDLDGGPGDDVVRGGSGPDAVRGGPGADTLAGGPGTDLLDGGIDGDTVVITDGAGEDTVDDTGTTGVDTLDLTGVTTAITGSTSFGDATAETTGITVAYASATIEAVLGGTSGDTFAFTGQEPDGFTFDGHGGDDATTFLSGLRDRTVSVTDSGASTGDSVTVLGTAAPDAYLLRAASTGLGTTATDGFVARLSGQRTDRYRYDSDVDAVTVDGGLSDDTFTLDDNAAATTVIGGQGDDVIQVGQIHGRAQCTPTGPAEGICTVASTVASTRGDAVGVAPADTFATTVITRGHLSNGVTHPLVVEGQDGDDSVTIFANHAPVTANGGSGSDQFVARAFVVAASIQLNGDGDVDAFQYVVNDQIALDGGDGVDGFTVIGTELDDGFILDVGADGRPTVRVCPLVDGRPVDGPDCAITAVVVNIEKFAALGLEGDDVFLIAATAAGSLIDLSGGEHSDRFIIGDGSLSRILGPVTVAGDATGDVPLIPQPVVLRGEEASPAYAPTIIGGTTRGDLLSVDASTDPADLTGELTDTAVRGFGMAAGPFEVGSDADLIRIEETLTHDELEFMTTDLGPGDDVATISSTHTGAGVCDDRGCPLDLRTGAGDDTVDVQRISGQTTIDLGAGDDAATVGVASPDGDVLDQIDARLAVIGGDGADALELDDRGDGATRLDLDPGLITRAGLADDGVTHTTVETIDVALGVGDDIINVRGTAADASTGTHVRSGDGDDRFHVSSTADLDVGESTDDLSGDVGAVSGPLFLHGDAGSRNQLLVSDTDAATGDDAIAYDGTVLSGMAPATISHDVLGGAFGAGIVLWSSELADVITMTGTDRSAVPGIRTLTTLHTGAGGDRATVTLDTATAGPVIIDTQSGDDTVVGAASTLGLIVFGGDGSDAITTGDGSDVVLGDVGRAMTADGGTVVGGGGPGDRTDGGTAPIDRLTSTPDVGAADTISTGGGADTIVGGVGGDIITAGVGDDLVIGGHVVGGGQDGGDTVDAGPGRDIVAGDNAVLDRTTSPVTVRLFDVVTTTTAAPAGTGAGDTVRGGDGDDVVLGQLGDDVLDGDAGDDRIEGNVGADTIRGGAGQDDLVGGGSALDGILDGTRTWVSGPTALADGNDTIDGDADADVVLGDNGWIQRQTTADGVPLRLSDLHGAQNPSYDGIVVRDARVSSTVDPSGSYGADLIRGGAGHDELHGQLDTTRVTARGTSIAGDEIDGGAGDDVIVGDLGNVRTVLEDGSRRRAISDSARFLQAVTREDGTLTREVELFAQHDADHVDVGDRSDATRFGAEGDDLMLGGEGEDRIHGGAGDDLANGGPGRDVLFGGDGQDALWGGPDADELFGGHDEDSLDVMPRDFSTRVTGQNAQTLGPDPAIWFEVAPATTAMAGLDLIYGGWNTDEMQADVKTNGPAPGDRLVDWSGAYNRYLSCERGGGAGSFLRGSAPGTEAFVTALADGRGAVSAATDGSSGSRELGIVRQEDGRYNTGSAGGDGHVACP